MSCLLPSQEILASIRDLCGQDRRHVGPDRTSSANLDAVLLFAASAVLRDLARRGFDPEIVRNILSMSTPRPFRATAYFAIRTNRNAPNSRIICAAVALQAADTTTTHLNYQVGYDGVGLAMDDCPPFILEALSVPTSALECDWRMRCGGQSWAYHIEEDLPLARDRGLRVVLERDGERVVAYEQAVTGTDQIAELRETVLAAFPMAAISAGSRRDGAKESREAGISVSRKA